MENRRNFLSKLGLASSLAALITPSLPALTMHEDFTRKGWRVTWRNWQGIVNQDGMVGLWLARSASEIVPTFWFLCSPYPGRCHLYAHGSVFDISVQSHQVLPTIATTREQLESHKRDAFNRMLKLIDEVGPPPLNQDYLSKLG